MEQFYQCRTDRLKIVSETSFETSSFTFLSSVSLSLIINFHVHHLLLCFKCMSRLYTFFYICCFWFLLQYFVFTTMIKTTFTRVSHFFYFCLSIFFSTSTILLLYSEDYYGDLDLKSIRKSELLAGLHGGEPKVKKTKN